MMEKQLQGSVLILRAINLVIDDVEGRDDSSDREEALKMLRELRQAVTDESQ